MIRVLLALAVLAIAGPVFAAGFVSDPAATCINSDEPSTQWATVTVEAGANRKFVVTHGEERNVDPAATFTVGGQAPTETVRFATTTPTTTDHYHYLYIWNEAAIALMTGSGTPTLSYSDANTAVGKGYCYGTIQNTTQANLGTTFTDSDVALNAGSLALTTTSGASDLVLVQSVAEGTGATHTWSAGITEIHDADGGDSWRYGVASGNADSVTVTYAVSTEDVSAVAMVFPDEPVTIAFSVAPTEVPATQGYTIAGTLTCAGTCTAYAVSYPPSVAAPSCTQIKASQDGAGSAALIAANEVWVTTVSNNFPLTGTNELPRHNVAVCGSDGTNNTAVTTFTNQDRSPCAGCAIIVNAGASATSPFIAPVDVAGDTTSGSAVITGMADTSDFQVGMLVTESSGFSGAGPFVIVDVTVDSITLDQLANATASDITITGLVDTAGAAYFNPTIATGDVLELAGASNIGGVVTGETDLDIIYDPDNGEEEDLASISACIQDVSDATGEYTRPDCWTGDLFLFYVNNDAPTFSLQGVSNIVFPVGSAITSIDFNGMCSHALTPMISIRSGSSWLANLTLTDGVLSGTIAAEDENGHSVDLWCEAGDLYDLQTFTFFAITTVPMPEITDETCVTPFTTCQAYDTLLAAMPWREESTITATSACSLTEAAGQVTAQSPAATTEITANQAITFEVSSGICPPAGTGSGGKGLNRFGFPFLAIPPANDDVFDLYDEAAGF